MRPGAYLMLWSTKEIAPLNEAYATAEFAPGLVLIGTNGGDTAYGLLDSGDGRRSYVNVPLVGMSLDAIELMGSSLLDFVASLQLDK